MTEELPWVSRGAPAGPAPASPEADAVDRRARASVDGSLRLDPREPWAGEQAPDGWSIGDWSQPGRQEAPEPPASRRQLREMRDAPVGPPATPPAPPAVPTEGDARQPPAAPPAGPPAWTTIAPAPAQPAAWPQPQPQARPQPSLNTRPGPPTGELEVYGLRRDPQRRSSRREPALPDLAEHGSARGEAFRAGVERWSRWAAGLGLPPRDPSGNRRYPGREGLFPPAVWLTVALGVTALVGLVTGIVIAPGSSSASVTTAIATTTVTVTNATTAPAVTVTTTRTRTATLTVAPTPTDAGQPAPNDQALAPGAQGPAVVALQQALAQLGLFQGAPTGTYDQQTQGAVQNFQARAGITQDPPGVAGPTTIQAINQALGR